MTTLQFRKAERKKAKLRLSVAGVTGAGKTCSSILIGKGLGGKMAMIDTENGRGDIHAHLADYDILRLEAPFTPAKYIEAIKLAEQEGYEVLIIDSLSHEWAGSGGCLEMAENVQKYSKNPNKFAAWADVTPQHNKLIEAIVSSRMHIIATMRSKSSYEVCENEKGKKVPKKLRLAPVQRDGMEFEFNVVLEIEKYGDKNIASASKDDTGIFKGEKEYFTPSAETGKQLLEWLLVCLALYPHEHEPIPFSHQRLQY